MKSKQKLLILIIGLSMISIVGAFFFQFNLGILPCELCLLQRWPHYIGVTIAVIALVFSTRATIIIFFGSSNSLVGVILSIYHSGIERAIWKGLSSCSGLNDISGMSTKELLNKILDTPVTKCNEISWSFLGFSLANINLLVFIIIFCSWLKIFINDQKL